MTESRMPLDSKLPLVYPSPTYKYRKKNSHSRSSSHRPGFTNPATRNHETNSRNPHCDHTSDTTPRQKLVAATPPMSPSEARTRHPAWHMPGSVFNALNPCIPKHAT
ncbi:hypothetical protein KC19_1G021600 [Ceratodon purpureus]|uniref:Uncharacterized protein n=1 Tax=Ceratodon purpureus TaxID=3225 RepID=A0A8T0J326_CERPU|nr:hypothetical protein KC19_1G021600 [Ceratodon purpureus]